LSFEAAADRIADMPRHELEILLSRAAIRLRNLPPPPDDGNDGDDAEYIRLIEEMNKPK
jgi:hypothetical protein